MPIAFTLAALLVLLAVGLLAVGRLGELPEADPERAPLGLPFDRVLTADDMQDVRFAVGARGYRMDEVDEVLDRVGADLAERDAHIGFLQRQFEVAGIDPYTEAGLADPAHPTRAGDPGPAGSAPPADAGGADLELAEDRGQAEDLEQADEPDPPQRSRPAASPPP